MSLWPENDTGINTFTTQTLVIKKRLFSIAYQIHESNENEQVIICNFGLTLTSIRFTLELLTSTGLINFKNDIDDDDDDNGTNTCY
jgi:transcription initiation factor IIE alpha subunit